MQIFGVQVYFKHANLHFQFAFMCDLACVKNCCNKYNTE